MPNPLIVPPLLSEAKLVPTNVPPASNICPLFWKLPAEPNTVNVAPLAMLMVPFCVTAEALLMLRLPLVAATVPRLFTLDISVPKPLIAPLGALLNIGRDRSPEGETSGPLPSLSAPRTPFNVPITAQNGWLYVGPVRLVRLEALRLR